MSDRDSNPKINGMDFGDFLRAVIESRGEVLPGANMPSIFIPPYTPAPMTPDKKMTAGDFVRDTIGATMNRTGRNYQDLPEQISLGKIENLFQKLWDKTLVTSKEHGQILSVKSSLDSHQLQASSVLVGNDVSLSGVLEFRIDQPPVLDVHTHPRHTTYRESVNTGLHFSETDFHNFLRPEFSLVAVVVSQDQRIMAMKTHETLAILSGFNERQLHEKIGVVWDPFKRTIKTSYSDLFAGVQRMCKFFKLGLYIAGPEDKSKYVRVREQ